MTVDSDRHVSEVEISAGVGRGSALGPVRTAALGLCLVLAFGAGFALGQGDGDHDGSPAADEPSFRVEESDSSVVVVDETTHVVRELTVQVGEEVHLVDVPNRIVESWADSLVSSDPAVVQVLDDTTILPSGPGTAELIWQTDQPGAGRPLYRVTVEE